VLTYKVLHVTDMHHNTSVRSSVSMISLVYGQTRRSTSSNGLKPGPHQQQCRSNIVLPVASTLLLVWTEFHKATSQTQLSAVANEPSCLLLHTHLESTTYECHFCQLTTDFPETVKTFFYFNNHIRTLSAEIRNQRSLQWLRHLGHSKH